MKIGGGVQISLQVVNSCVINDVIVCLQSSIATVQPSLTWNFTHRFNEQSLANCCWNSEKRFFSGCFNHPYCIPWTQISAACSDSFGLQQSSISSSVWLVDLTAIEHEMVPTGEYLNKNCWFDHSGKAQNGGLASFEQNNWPVSIRVSAVILLLLFQPCTETLAAKTQGVNKVLVCETAHAKIYRFQQTASCTA